MPFSSSCVCQSSRASRPSTASQVSASSSRSPQSGSRWMSSRRIIGFAIQVARCTPLVTAPIGTCVDRTLAPEVAPELARDDAVSLRHAVHMPGEADGEHRHLELSRLARGMDAEARARARQSAPKSLRKPIPMHESTWPTSKASWPAGTGVWVVKIELARTAWRRVVEGDAVEQLARARARAS